MPTPQVSKAILDTSALIDVLDGVQAATKLIASVPETFLPVFALAELYFMAENSKYKTENYQRVEVLRSQFSLLEVTIDVAYEYARVRYDMRLTHPKMPVHDLWIAAYARLFNVPLIAKDKHFSAIPNLTVITW